jgi:hypothetical protein
MKKVLCSSLPILMIALVIAVFSGASFAQVEGEFFTTNYFANNTASGAPDGTLRYTEHFGGILSTGLKLCANIYVFDAQQEPTECCSCLITPNGLVTASVKALTSNPLQGAPQNIPNDGVIQIISSRVPPQGCDATFGLGGQMPSLTNGPFPEVDSWMTHIQNKVGTAYPITEGEGVEELLTPGEFFDLAVDCALGLEFGSGQGDCTAACGTEK